MSVHQLQIEESARSSLPLAKIRCSVDQSSHYQCFSGARKRRIAEPFVNKLRRGWYSMTGLYSLILGRR
jgi:hypothetical protein